MHDRDQPHKCRQSLHYIIKDLQRLCSLFWQVGAPLHGLHRNLCLAGGPLGQRNNGVNACCDTMLASGFEDYYGRTGKL